MKIVLLFSSWIIIFIFGLFYLIKQPPISDSQLASHLSSSLKICTENKTNRNSCTRKLAVSDLNRFSFKQILSALEILQSQNLTSQHFHDYLHFLAMEKYYKQQNLPELFSECTSVYYSSCYHGAVIGLLNNSSDVENNNFKNTMSHACDEFLNLRKFGHLEQCVHGVGHALMIANNYRLPQALELCDNFTDWSSTCYGGVFMENFPQSSSSDRLSSFLPTPSDIYYPCSKLAEKHLEQCYIFLSNYHNYSDPQIWNQSGKFCQGIPKNVQSGCFDAIGNSVIPTTENIFSLKDICEISSISSQDRLSCYLGIVGAFDDKFGGNDNMVKLSVDYCLSLENTYQPSCFTRVSKVLSKWLNPDIHLATCIKIQNTNNKNLCSTITEF